MHFPESLEHHNHVLNVLFKWIQKEKYIIKIYMYKPSDEIIECDCHQTLKSRWGITVPHLYYLALKCAKYHRECSFIHVLRFNAYLLISSVMSSLDLKSAHTTSWQIVSCSGKGVTSSHVLLFCCLRFNMGCKVPFFSGIHSMGMVCLPAAGIHHPAVVYYLIFLS